MGKMQAEEMKELIGDLISLDQAIIWHLQGNHYPPIHPVFLETAKKAIACEVAGESETMIEMPNGITLSAFQIIEELHLQTFIDEGVLQ